MNDDHLYKIALECSLKSDYTGAGRAKIGCIAVYKGSILAKGYNTDKTHSRQAIYNKWRYKKCENIYLPAKTHAEIRVISKIKYLDIDFSRVHLYTYRETREGKIAMSRPCPACMAAIKEMGIKYIHYTTNDGKCFEILEGKHD